VSRLLITGGVGYIGSHSAVVLSEIGHEVVLYDNFSNSSHCILENLALIVGRHIPFVKGDVRDTELLASTLASHSIDAVFILLGFEKATGREVPYKIVARRAGDVAACYADPKKASERLNWTARRCLDDMCAACGVSNSRTGLALHNDQQN